MDVSNQSETVAKQPVPAPSFGVWGRFKAKLKYTLSANDTKSKSDDTSKLESKSNSKSAGEHSVTVDEAGSSHSEGYRNPSDTQIYESSVDDEGRAGAPEISSKSVGTATKENEAKDAKDSTPTPKHTLPKKTMSAPVSRQATEQSISAPKPDKIGILAHLEESVLECNAEYENLQIIVTLGAGAFGRVDLVQDRMTGRSYALKTISKVKVASKASSIAHLYNEKKALQTIKSDFVVKMYKTFNLEHKCCFLFEPILGGELFTFMQINKRFTERMSRFYAGCTILALEDIHNMGMVYRDLKPENMLIGSDGYLKFADFGFAKTLKPWAKSFSLVGTPEYLPPEIIANEGHDRGFDMWTLGVLIYEMLSRRTPFHDRHRRTMFNKICNVRYSFPAFFPAEAADLVRNLLRRRPIYRLGVVGGMESIKKHPWFDGFDWEALRNRTMKAPYVPKVRSSTDTSNFARVNKDKVPKFPSYTKDQAIFDGF